MGAASSRTTEAVCGTCCAGARAVVEQRHDTSATPDLAAAYSIETRLVPASCNHATMQPAGRQWEYQLQAALLRLASCSAPFAPADVRTSHHAGAHESPMCRACCAAPATLNAH